MCSDRQVVGKIGQKTTPHAAMDDAAWVGNPLLRRYYSAYIALWRKVPKAIPLPTDYEPRIALGLINSHLLIQRIRIIVGLGR